MEIYGGLIISLIAGLSTVLGGLTIFIKTDKRSEMLTFCLSLAASVMITMSVVELIPESSLILTQKYGFILGICIFIIVFILSILLIKFINNKLKIDDNLYRVGILSMIALFIHNFPEGVAVYISSYADIELGLSIGLAIMLHNIPEGISIAVPIYYATKNSRKALFYTFLSGLAEPIGALLAYIFLIKYINKVMISFTLIMVAGIMITIAINKLFKEALNYQKQNFLIIGSILGIILVLINYFL